MVITLIHGLLRLFLGFGVALWAAFLRTLNNFTLKAVVQRIGYVNFGFI